MPSPEEMSREFNLSDEDFQETARACGLSLSQKNYSDQERERFAEARNLLDEGVANSYEDLTHYFQERGVRASEDDPETTPAPLSNSTNPLAQLKRQAIQAGFELGLQQAEVLAQAIPQATMLRLNQMIENGQLRQEFLKLWQEQAVASLGKEEIRSLVESEWLTHQLNASQNPTGLLESSTESSENV